ncbi:hypothetical protein SEUCBS139899_007321 [Sporothrix eucalyptigena]
MSSANDNTEVQEVREASTAHGGEDLGIQTATDTGMTVSKPLQFEKWFIWGSFALAIYVMGLSSMTLAVYLNTAASVFNSLVQYTTLGTVQDIIYGVGNVVFAKLADGVGRPFVFSFSIVSWAVGTIIMASSHSIATLSAGMIFYSFGNTGLILARNLLLADLVPAHWRCTANNLLLAPFIINFGVSSKITAKLVPDNWRWGIGMFAILVPVTMAPITYYLYRMAYRAHRLLVDSENAPPRRSFRQIARAVYEFDIPGQLLLLFGFGLLLLPLTIADQAPKGYATGYIIAMFVLGAVCLIAFPFVEKFAPVPSIDFSRLRRLGGGWDVIVATAISMADALSVMIAYTPSYNWVRITFDYSVQNATYYLYASSLAVVIFGIIGGLIATYTRRYKWLAVFGAAMRLMALGLMYLYRGPECTTAQIIVPQVLQGIGTAVMTANLQVAAQISVSHADVAMVTGIFLMWGGIADGAGSAIVGAIQQELLPELTKSLSGIANSTVIESIYESGPLALVDIYPLGDPVRMASIEAWTKNTRQVLAAALAIAGVNFLLTFLLKDRVLPDTQNAVTDEATGLPVHFPNQRNEKAEELQRADEENQRTTEIPL